MSNLQKGLIAAAIAVIVVAVIAFTALRNTGGPPQPDLATANSGQPQGASGLGAMSPAAREGYIASATASCKTTALKDQHIVEAHTPESTVEDYCRCVSNKSADAITVDDIAAISGGKGIPPAFNDKLQEMAKICAAQYLTPSK